MRNKLCKYLLHLFILLFIILEQLPTYSVAQNNIKPKNWVVVIDAGHGGKDPGTIGLKSKEKDIALSIALKLGKYISENFNDVKIIYTRSDDTFIPLDERSKIANNAHADLFISIHCNSAPNKNVYGAETYVMGLHRSEDNLDVAMRENAVITLEDDYSVKYEGYDPNSTESFIIFSMLQNAFLDQSLNLAETVQSDFRERANRKDRGVRQAGFLVLWKTAMPSVLVEVGYLSNPREENFLITDDGQSYIASSIYRAFKEYKTNYDNYNKAIAKGMLNSSTNNEEVEKHSKQASVCDTSKNENSPIEFKIQVAVSSDKLKPNKTFKQIGGIYELHINGVYKYCYGNYSNYNDAQNDITKIKTYYPDAFIIALKNGIPIPIKLALEEQAAVLSTSNTN